MKAPKNFYNTVDQRKLGLEDGLLPDVTAADNGKILKVSGGKWQPGDDENTIIEANPDEQPTVDLENLKIGDTVYSVKNPELTSIKSFKLTMSNGGQYNTNKPIIEFFNEAGQKAAITSSDYTVECDKTYAGNAGMDQVCSITTPDTPGTFTYTFVNDFDIETYKLMKLTRGGTFVNDIAKNIKIELSADGENYITIYDETTITWSDAVPYHLISLKDGSEASTLLPIVTTANNGKLLEVIDGVWGVGDDLYRVGDIYSVPFNLYFPQQALSSGAGIDMHLPIIGKLVDVESVKWIEFSPNTKVNLTSVDGSKSYFQVPINDIFDFNVRYSKVGSDYINLYTTLKQGYDLTGLGNNIIFVSFISANITFLANKPTT